MELLLFIALFILGLLSGIVLMFVLLKARVSRAEQEALVAKTRLETLTESQEERRKLLEEAQLKLTTTFQALSGESLKSNNQAFLDLAKESLGKVVEQAKGQFGEKEESIKGVVGSLEEALKNYNSQIKDLEQRRAQDFGSLDSQIKLLASSNQDLQKETGNLINALRRPEVRGRWGEVTLKRVVELAGMSEHCDFTEQASTTNDENRYRPDMVVHLPQGRDVIVDSKVPLDAYLNAIHSRDEDEKKVLLDQHAKQVRTHMKSLSQKAYWEQFQATPEFVVMFIPGESFLTAAIERDHTIIENGMESKVIIATPTTLVALLRAIAFGWRQERLNENAEKIAALAREVFDRFQPFLHHVNSTGDALSKATSSYNKMIRSLEQRVLVSVKKFKDMGAAGDRELAELTPIEQVPLQTQEKLTEA